MTVVIVCTLCAGSVGCPTIDWQLMSAFFSFVGTLKKPFVAIIDGITMGGVRVGVTGEGRSEA